MCCGVATPLSPGGFVDLPVLAGRGRTRLRQSPASASPTSCLASGKSKEAEIKRINKELANIRSKFKGDKALDGYSKKKYVCKLLFIFLLGHDIDFGHMEAVNLLSSNRYTEKQIGYLFISVLVNSNSELIRLINNAVKNDLGSRNPTFTGLALHCIANVGSREMAEAFAGEIPKILVAGDTMDSVKQSAALCLLRLYRTSPDLVPMGDWTSRVVHLLNDQHLGVVTAAASLITTLAQKNPEEFKTSVSLAVSRLSRIVTSASTDLQDYTYYFVPAPWLSVKLLRLLQCYPPPGGAAVRAKGSRANVCPSRPEDPAVRGRLTECLETILNKAQEPPKSKKVQHSNAKNAVLFEAISLVVHHDSEPNLLVRACNQLGQFLQHRETNLRYLALESMCTLASSEFSHEAVKTHIETVINALKATRVPSVATASLTHAHLSLQTKPVDPTVDGGAQVQQAVNIECVSDFTEAPVLNIQFRYGGTFQNVSVKLPITLNKFFQPTEMASQDFFQRWKQLSNPQQEVQNIFKAKHPMDTEITKAKMYRLTLRTSRETVSQRLCELLSEQF
eukprot:bmy_04998T0